MGISYILRVQEQSGILRRRKTDRLYRLSACRRKTTEKEFEKYPKYRQAYVHAFDRMVDVLKAKGKQTFDLVNGKYWKDGESVMRWWVGDDPIQMTIDDYMKLLEAEQSIMEEYR